jgi:aminopeptidase
MKDQRADALARILVEYSCDVKAGEICMVQGETAGEPLLLALYEQVLKKGAYPVVDLMMDEQSPIFFKHATDAQLEWVPPPAKWSAEHADARLRVMADTNTRALSGIDPERQTRRQTAVKPLMETMMKRSAAGEMRWALTLFPTQAYAAEADMSLSEYEDFFYRACLCDQPDPVAAWRHQSDETRRLAEWMAGKEEVRLEGPGTDLTLNVSGRTFVAADGRHNMPDGEFFTGPVEDSVEGEVTFSYPAVYGGREVAGVKLRFEQGRVVDASAERNEEFLVKTLDTDDGARRLGELGIGTNYGIDRFTKEILLDEKIGGTIHLAVGMSYPETGGKNSSAVHWDMVCDLRQGGRITVDGVELQADGKFAV